MEPYKSIDGKTYAHEGQLGISYYDLFQKSAKKRENLNINFTRKGKITVKFYDHVCLCINPTLQRIDVNPRSEEQLKIVTYILDKILCNVKAECISSSITSNVNMCKIIFQSAKNAVYALPINYIGNSTLKYCNFNLTTERIEVSNIVTYYTYRKEE